MPPKILTTQDGRGKYYLTEMDYRPTEAEIYADGWEPPVKISNLCDDFVGTPRGPYTKPMDADYRRIYREIGFLDEHDRVTEQGRKLGLTQAEVDGTETEEDIYKQEAIQAERFRIAEGEYFQGDRRAREVYDYE